MQEGKRYSPPLPLSLSLSLCRSVAISLPRPTYAPEMLRCKTVDCHGAVFSLCTAMVAVGVPGTTEGRRPRPPHRALPRDYVYYTYSVRRARARARVRTYVRVLTRDPLANVRLHGRAVDHAA